MIPLPPPGRALRAASVLALVSLAACNSGLGTIFSSSSESPSDSPSTISGFSIASPKTSPAPVSFRMIDGNGGTVEVTLFFRLPGGAPVAMTRLGGSDNPAPYEASASGIEHTVMWDFAAEPDLPADGSFVDGITVWAAVTGNDEVIDGSNAVLSGLGNDAPAVDAIDTPASEVSGVVPVGVSFSDSSSDLVSARVEYRLESESSWHLARPAGVSSTPALAFVGLSAPASGVSTNFFWDTNFDLPDQEHDVRLRFTLTDGTDESAPYESDVFRVDNNAQVLVLLDNGLVTLSTDVSGGIAIPFTLRDAESDDARVVFQWRRPGEPFRALPADPEEVFALQASPRGRVQYQICSEVVTYVGGRPVEVDSTHLRLPEMGTSSVNVPSADFAGRRLEILRAPELLFEASATWSANPLQFPVAIVPLGDGLEALALDDPGGGWRLRRIELATGAVLADVTTGSGAPTGLTVSPDESTAFVAAAGGASWTVDRIDLATGASAAQATGTFGSPEGIRGVAALSNRSLALTVDDLVQVVEFGGGAPLVETLLQGLDTPWGVVRDPLQHDALLVAEHGADRVLHVDRATSARYDVRPDDPSPAPLTEQLGFPAPRGIALARSGVQLLVACESVTEGRQLRSLNRGSTHDLDGTGFANAAVFVHASLPGSVGGSLATGADGLRVLVDTAASGVHVMGGVEQRREIVSSTAGDNLVELGEPLDPPLGGPGHGRTWRMQRVGDTFHSSPHGRQHAFPWDSSDKPGGGSVLLRAVAFDSEFGVSSETSLERALVASFETRSLVVEQDPATAVAIPTAVDVDRDGDLDLLLAAGPDTRFYRQVGKGRYGTTPVPLAVDLSNSLPHVVNCGASTPPTLAWELLVEDLDADGNLDVAHVNASREVEIFHGTGPETFSAVPVVLPIPGDTAPFSLMTLHAADRDGDGDLDLLVTGTGEPLPPPMTDPPTPAEPVIDFIGFFDQTSPGVWSTDTTNLAVEGLTDVPRDVVVRDIDMDGREDLLVAVDGATTIDGSILVLFQEEFGAFPAEDSVSLVPDLDLPAGFGVGATRAAALVRAADLDGDGDLDILCGHGRPFASFQNVVSPAYAGTVSVHMQTSPRAFDEVGFQLRPAGGFQLTRRLSGLEVADVNGDGHLDVVTQDLRAVSLFFGRGGGAFEADPLNLEFETPADYCTSVDVDRRLIVRDLNGDGRIDLAYQESDTAKLVVRIQPDAGLSGFSSTPMIFDGTGASDSTIGANDSVISDFDGDGDMDFAICTGGIGFGAPNDFKIFFQSSPRVFVSTPLQLGASGGPLLVQFPQRVYAADVDSDGDRDLVGISNGTDQIMIFHQDGPGSYGAPQLLDGVTTVDPVNAFFNSVNGAGLADLDLDGDLDVVGTPNRLAQLVVHEQTRPGEYESFELGEPVPPELILDEPLIGFAGLRAADFDDDGRIELAVPAFGDVHDLHVYDAVGARDEIAFSDPGALIAGLGGQGLQVADVNGDGRLDLLTWSPAPDMGPTRFVLGLRNDADGYDLVEIPAGDLASGLGSFTNTSEAYQLVDVDRDGDLDILYVEAIGPFGIGRLVVLEQVAPGLFAPELAFSRDEMASTVQVGDIDGDGELDLLLPHAGFGTGNVRILWGGGE